MEKTQNYNLNKPESTDPLRVADFNQNADKIDAALKDLNTAVGTKAEQSAVNALTTAVASAGNCKIAAGTYKGTNKYGSANPTKLEVGFAPKLVLIGFEGENCRLFTPVLTRRFDFGSSFSSEAYTATWGDTYFSVYSTSAYGQLNSSDRTYNYIIIG